MTTNHDTRNGSPYDRGESDFYYRRPFRPHYYVNATRITDLTAAELEAYRAGFEDAEAAGFEKDYT